MVLGLEFQRLLVIGDGLGLPADVQVGVAAAAQGLPFLGAQIEQLDLHAREIGATAFQDFVQTEPLGDSPAVVLETAHPAKFPEEIERLLGFSPEMPLSLATLDHLPEDCDRMAADYGQFNRYLINHYGHE